MPGTYSDDPEVGMPKKYEAISVRTFGILDTPSLDLSRLHVLSLGSPTGSGVHHEAPRRVVLDD